MTARNSIPLSSVAEDTQSLIKTYRDNGEVSFQDVSFEEARLRYRDACAQNGLATLGLAVVRDHSVPVKGGSILVREYRSSAPSSRTTLKTPAALFIHGGGWVVGDLETHDAICRLIASESGIPLFAVDYRLAPEYQYPIPLDDCACALDWLVSNAEQLSINPHKLAIIGDSAGANMAAVLANNVSLRPKGIELQAQVLFYPVTDMRAQTESYQRITSGFPLTSSSMYWFLDAYIGLEKEILNHPYLSPLLAQEVADAPMFLLSCGLDPLADDGVLYARKHIDLHHRVEHHHLPRHPHGILTSAGCIETGREMVMRSAAFLLETLKLS